LIDIGLEGQKFILVFIRVLSMIWLLPLFQSRNISRGYKTGLSLIVAYLLLSSVPAIDFEGSGYRILLAVGGEVLVGLSLGFVLRVIFGMVSAAGELMSMQSGLSFARTVDPTVGASVTVLEQFQNLLAILVFLGIDGHHTVLKGIAVSLREIPPGSIAVKPALFQYMAASVGSLFPASLRICAPVVVTLFLVDVGLGIVARLIPQINVFIEGASVKMLITLGMLAISLNLIVPVIGGLFRGFDSDILRIMRSMV
jgi:flagellar biosynthesis protein FliR